MLMYSMISYLSTIALENSFEKVGFQFFPEIEMMRNENWLLVFGCHFETVQIFSISGFSFFFAGIWL